MQRILKLSLALTFLYILATFIFGLRAHSLALLSEAGHNISDFLALALSFFAVYLQTRPATDPLEPDISTWDRDCSLQLSHC